MDANEAKYWKQKWAEVCRENEILKNQYSGVVRRMAELKQEVLELKRKFKKK